MYMDAPPLPESVALLSARCFAECFSSGTWQRYLCRVIPLPSAALGKV
jgi:hypothetical protein